MRRSKTAVAGPWRVRCSKVQERMVTTPESNAKMDNKRRVPVKTVELNVADSGQRIEAPENAYVVTEALALKVTSECETTRVVRSMDVMAGSMRCVLLKVMCTE